MLPFVGTVLVFVPCPVQLSNPCNYIIIATLPRFVNLLGHQPTKHSLPSIPTRGTRARPWSMRLRRRKSGFAQGNLDARRWKSPLACTSRIDRAMGGWICRRQIGRCGWARVQLGRGRPKEAKVLGLSMLSSSAMQPRFWILTQLAINFRNDKLWA